jgi:hypothetical protein
MERSVASASAAWETKCSGGGKPCPSRRSVKTAAMKTYWRPSWGATATAMRENPGDPEGRDGRDRRADAPSMRRPVLRFKGGRDFVLSPGCASHSMAAGPRNRLPPGAQGHAAAPDAVARAREGSSVRSARVCAVSEVGAPTLQQAAPAVSSTGRLSRSSKPCRRSSASSRNSRGAAMDALRAGGFPCGRLTAWLQPPG